MGRVIIDGIVDPTLLATEETAPVSPQRSALSFSYWHFRLTAAFRSQVWAFHELADADKAYEVFLTGCALAGPQGCPIASAEGQTAADIDANIQALLKQAHDAARKNASVPVTSEIIRGMYLCHGNYLRRWLAELVFDLVEELLSVIESPSQAAVFVNTTWPMLVADVQAESGSEFLTARHGIRPARRRCVFLSESLRARI